VFWPRLVESKLEATSIVVGTRRKRLEESVLPNELAQRRGRVRAGQQPGGVAREQGEVCRLALPERLCSRNFATYRHTH
jgi:hypothetical protein